MKKEGNKTPGKSKPVMKTRSKNRLKRLKYTNLSPANSASQNNDDQDYQINRDPPHARQKRRKNYRKQDSKAIRKVKVIAFSCLKYLHLDHLFKYWSKKNEGLRNKRFTILLILMILYHEQEGLVHAFIKKYKEDCMEIIQGRNKQYEKIYSTRLFDSIKFNLVLSIDAAEAFIESDYNIDIGLRIMQQEKKEKDFKQAKADLEKYKVIISQNKHKKQEVQPKNSVEMQQSQQNESSN